MNYACSILDTSIGGEVEMLTFAFVFTIDPQNRRKSYAMAIENAKFFETKEALETFQRRTQAFR